MRIDFQNSGETLEAVTPAQIEMRDARIRKRPILGFVILLIILGGGAYGYYLFSRVDTIYTYGLVEAKYTPYYAPFEGTISGLNLERGQLVSKDDVLFTLTPAPSETVREAQDALLDEIERLDEQAGELRANVIEQAQKDVDRLQAAYDDESARRQAAESNAGIELQKLKNVYTSRKRQSDRVSDLFAMGAAIQSDVDIARDASDVAYHTWKQAELGLSVAQEQNEASIAALDKAKLELDRLSRENASDARALERGRLKLSVAQTRPDDLTVRSLFDGIVLEVGAVEGSRVEAERIVISVADRKNIWVEAYVSEKYARHIHAGAEVIVRIPGSGIIPKTVIEIPGTIANDPTTAIRVPELLRDNLPRQQSGIYVRINLSLTDDTLILPGGQVEVVIPTA